MAKRKQSMPGRQSAGSTTRTESKRFAEKPATLRDLLDADILQKLQAQADQLKAEEARREEEKLRQLEEARKAEQKRLENNFEHLLKNSKLDWRQYK
jgi:flagellar motility protein MotE (MotC chaperone)